MSERIVRVYYVTRDSVGGVLSDRCNLWRIKPMRSRHVSRVTWIPISVLDHGHLGEHPLADIEAWFKTKPDTDIECVRIEQWASEQS